MAAHRGYAIIAALVWLAGCGDSSAPNETGSQTGDRVDALGLVRDAGSGPSLEQIGARIVDNVNTLCRLQRDDPDAPGEMGKVANIRETARNTEKFDGGGQAVVVDYEATIEFTAACNYQDADRRPGDTLAVYGMAEFVNEGGAWAVLPISIWSR